MHTWKQNDMTPQMPMQTGHWILTKSTTANELNIMTAIAVISEQYHFSNKSVYTFLLHNGSQQHLKHTQHVASACCLLTYQSCIYVFQQNVTLNVQ
jgi:hypothetical protein